MKSFQVEDHYTCTQFEHIFELVRGLSGLGIQSMSVNIVSCYFIYRSTHAYSQDPITALVKNYSQKYQ